MSAIFVQLSDIHFGQERDHTVHIHDDVKTQLIADARHVVRDQLGAGASGILVTGDISHSGAKEEYAKAALWLDALAAEVGCPINRVQMIPGNHDMDRTKHSMSAEHVLDMIRAGGAAEYEKAIANDVDRAALFTRFENYGNFSFGYRCALDEKAKYATNLMVELAPGRSIRFIRMNSSLLCTGKERDDRPELMIGERQFTLPRNDGEENIVLVHHPLHWMKDGDAFKRYVRSRARVFISGHEHDPKVGVDPVSTDCDLLMLAAGATVPFKSNETYTFTYNIIEFDWDRAQDALAVTIHPRAWNPERTCFEADEKRLGGKDPRFTLGSPNFRNAPRPAAADDKAVEGAEDAKPVVELVPAEPDREDWETVPKPPIIDGYDLIMLRFFRDLLESERLRILMALDALASDSDERMTQGVERKLLDWLAKHGKLSDVARMMDELIAERGGRSV